MLSDFLSDTILIIFVAQWCNTLIFEFRICFSEKWLINSKFSSIHLFETLGSGLISHLFKEIISIIVVDSINAVS
jgi:hypothetical protein